MTPEMLRDKCKVKGDIKQIVKESTMQFIYRIITSQESMERIIHRHQRLPGSIWRGLLDRFIKKRKSH